jgi:hypothetical protein
MNRDKARRHSLLSISHDPGKAELFRKSSGIAARQTQIDLQK